MAPRARPGRRPPRRRRHLRAARAAAGAAAAGRHVLELRERQVPLLVAPRTAEPPADRREWGLAVQLYALRSRRSWGIGDLGDLAHLPAAAGWPGFVLLSPLHAPVLAPPVQPSPYYGTSRRVRNPLHVARWRTCPRWRR